LGLGGRRLGEGVIERPHLRKKLGGVALSGRPASGKTPDPI
jgi:hypothetical protein